MRYRAGLCGLHRRVTWTAVACEGALVVITMPTPRTDSSALI